MVRLKRILILFFVLFITLSIKVQAGEKISYGGITTYMPEIVNQNFKEEDAKEINREIDSLITLNNESKIDVNVGGYVKPDENISTLISRFSNENTVVGIDVSSHQGEIDWKQVADSGVKFAMIRCGFRGYGSEGKLVKDTYFDKNIQGALNNGIYVGVYFYSTALNEEEALQEAELTYQCIKNYDLKYPVSYDFEEFEGSYSAEEFKKHRTSTLSSDQMHKNAKLFLNYIKEKGYVASLYGSASHLKNIWKMGEFSNYETWVAHYYVASPNYSGSYQMWQYTDNATVPGISTKVDVDIDYAYWTGMKAKISLMSYIKGKGWNSITRKLDNGLTNTDWFFVTDEGIIAIGWRFINGKWYYFDTNTGVMLSNCSKKVFDKIYVFEKSGKWRNQLGWFCAVDNNNNTKWYYINTNGTALTGWAFYKNVWYYLNPDDGSMACNETIYDDGIVYLFNSNGHWIKPNNGWYKTKNNWHYIESGYGIIGWRKIDNVWYYFDKGIMQKGWHNINNKWYFFEGNGSMVSNKYIDLGGNIYCFESTGEMISSKWAKIDNNWFFLRKDGIAVKGWKKINNKWYYFDNNSAIMACNTVLNIKGNFYGFDNSGAMIENQWCKTNDLKWYYFGNNGIQEKRNGWQFIEENWYYINDDCSVTVEWKKIENIWFYFDKDGKMLSNTFYEIDGKIYLFNISGFMYSNGWFYNQGKWYYFTNSGVAIADGWGFIDNKWYYFNEDATMFNDGEKEIKGIIYVFDKSGALIEE